MKFHLLIAAFALLGCFSLQANQADTTLKSPAAYFKLDGNATDAVGGKKAVIKNGKVADGYSGKAYAFTINKKNYSTYTRNITFPVDINPAKSPLLTVTAWIKASNYFNTMYLIGNGTDKNTRGLILKTDDDMYRWGMNCGKDGILYGPALVNEWTFIAMMYDSKNQEARLVVNNTVYASRAAARSGEEKAFVGEFDGVIDDIRFYNHILSQSEIEAISGQPITQDADLLTIKDKYAYKERFKKEKENKLVIGGFYIIDKQELKVYDTTNTEHTSAILKSGDSLLIKEKLADAWYKISYSGKTGFARRAEIINKAYPAGTSALKFRFMNWLSTIFDFTRLSSWIVVVISAVILFFVKRYFVYLDSLLLRLRRNHDEFEGGGSKSDAAKPKRINFLHKIYPVRSYQWYPLLGGILLGATLFVGSFWDNFEMEWFFNEGINILPIGYDRPVHWFLYIMTMVILLLTLSWIVESFVVGGPFVGLLRIFILLILNFMSLLVSFFLLVLIAIVVVGIIALRVFGSAVGSGSYQCPSCGRSFSAGAGSSVSCPGCGARLST